MFSSLHYYAAQIKEYKMDGECSMQGINGKLIQKVRRKNPKGRDHLDDLGEDGMIILKWFLNEECMNV
jgi:hypothetical protein